ncbi:hypothetical protein [Glycomyces artemisiae]|uniref:DUF3618 domain-containing protein n=1 Tax=Glycomyces artemisiae TaxID=1076443 RepID=A0A2T0UWB3_9ACTN|nr:hypothetical protein [Glycomyces artemisiae]PRY62221.1 hypothetical protein B0I28_101548 [Glycomyces artemisiae]
MTRPNTHPADMPPGAGLAPPPSTGMPYQPDVEVVRRDDAEEHEHRHDWSEADEGSAEAAAKSAPEATVEELMREADHARDRIDEAVHELRERLGLSPDAEHAHGPFAPVRRHPFTVAVAAAGAVTATVVTVAVTRGHRRAESRSARESARLAAASATIAAKYGGNAVKLAAGDAAKAARRGRKSGRKGLDRTVAAVGSAADRLRPKRRSKFRRLISR